MRHLVAFLAALTVADGAAACSGDTFAGGFDAAATAHPDADAGAGIGDAAEASHPASDRDQVVWVDPRPWPSSRAGAFGSIQRAIDEAARRHVPRVAVCAGVYREALVLAPGVAVEGGFACERASALSITRVEAPTSPAVAARDLADAPGERTRLSRVEIVAPDARSPSASSIALLAVRSPGLTLADVRLIAGRGADGADGAPALALLDAATKDAAGSTPGTNACVGAIGREGGPGGGGGAGGRWKLAAGVLVVDPSDPRTDGDARPATSETALGGTLASAPRAGRDGRPGAPGASAASFGALGEAGFVAGDGTPGGDGAPGQGGGGGAGAPPLLTSDDRRAAIGWTPGVDGGGGGAGGCPGLAGGAGRGGGASVALLSAESALTLEGDVVLVTASGGRGGRGTPGSGATPGGRGAASADAGAGGRAGAAGGAGGAAGFSGHGAGGPSIGWARDGAAARVAGARLSTTVGAAGSGRAAEGPIPRSADGVAAAVYTF